MRALLLIVLSACGIQEIGGGAGLDLPWLEVVRECDTTRIAPPELVEMELCSDLSDGDLEQSLEANGYEGATCWATDRHAGPCIHCCGSDCGRGSNAYNGSWCPPPDEVP